MSDLALRLLISTDAKGASAGLVGLRGDLSSVRGEVGATSRALESMRGVLGGLGVVALGREMLVVNRQFAIQRAALETLTGSAAMAVTEFDRLSRIAAATPYSVGEVTSAYTKLRTLGLEPSERALTSYGNTAAAMGKDLNQLIEAVADATTGEFERLKEFGIKARQNGDQVSLTFKGVTTTVRNEANAIQAYLLRLGETDFAAAMARRAATLDGAMSNLGDSWDRMLDRVLSGRLESGLSTSIGILSAGLDTIGRFADLLNSGAGSSALMAGALALLSVRGVAALASMVRLEQAQAAQILLDRQVAAATLANAAAREAEALANRAAAAQVMLYGSQRAAVEREVTAAVSARVAAEGALAAANARTVAGAVALSTTLPRVAAAGRAVLGVFGGWPGLLLTAGAAAATYAFSSKDAASASSGLGAGAAGASGQVAALGDEAAAAAGKVDGLAKAIRAAGVENLGSRFSESIKRLGEQRSNLPSLEEGVRFAEQTQGADSPAAQRMRDVRDQVVAEIAELELAIPRYQAALGALGKAQSDSNAESVRKEREAASKRGRIALADSARDYLGAEQFAWKNLLSDQTVVSLEQAAAARSADLWRDYREARAKAIKAPRSVSGIPAEEVAAAVIGREALEAEVRALEDASRRAQAAISEQTQLLADQVQIGLKPEAQAQRELREYASQVADQFERSYGPQVDVLTQKLGDNEAAHRRVALSMASVAAQASSSAPKTWADGWDKAFSEYQKGASDAAKAGEDSAKRMLGSLEDQLTSFISGQKFSWRSLADTIIAELARVQARNIISSLLPGMGSGGGGGFGGLASMASSAWSWVSSLFAQGGVMTPAGALDLPVRAYSQGGVATSPQVAVYGEGHWNEAYVPLPDGRSIPVKQDVNGIAAAVAAALVGAAAPVLRSGPGAASPQVTSPPAVVEVHLHEDAKRGGEVGQSQQPGGVRLDVWVAQIADQAVARGIAMGNGLTDQAIRSRYRLNPSVGY